MHTLLALLLAVLMAGCATAPRLIELQGFDGKSTVQRAVDPIAFVGLPTSGDWEKFYRTGQVFGAVVEFPTGSGDEGLENEFDVLLPFYDALTVREDGREFPARAQIVRSNDCKLKMLFIVGGTNNPAGLKGVIASTLSERMYQLRKGMGISAKIAEFQSENLSRGEYRRSFVLRHGTPLTGFEYVPAEKIRGDYKNWNEVRGASHVGTFLVPPWVNYDEVNSVATLNPRYSFSEKFASTATLTIVPNAIGTGISALSDVIGAVRAPSRGRDSKSIPGERNEASQFVLNELKTQCQPQVNQGARK